MGVGSNPAVWVVAVTGILSLVRYWLDTQKEVSMKTENKVRKTCCQMKSNVKRVLLASFETMWVIAAGLTAGLATPSIY